MLGSAQATSSTSSRRFGKLALVLFKCIVTAGCFWYLALQVDVRAVARSLPAVDLTWAGIAVLGVAFQILLIGVRWSVILDALGGQRVPRRDAIAMTWISTFLGQVLPYAAGDALRVWMLSGLGRDWRTGVISILIDRGVGIAMLFAFGFGILLMPSALTALAGYRGTVLVVFGGATVGFLIGLACVPWLAPVLARWRQTRWIATFALACHDVLVSSRAGVVVGVLAFVVHTVTIFCVWSVGRSLGIELPLADAAVLFVLMLGVALIPVSIGGWGVREVAVVALLASHGVAPEIALSLSVTFGIVVVLGSLPGAIIWLGYSPARQAP